MEKGEQTLHKNFNLPTLQPIDGSTFFGRLLASIIFGAKKISSQRLGSRIKRKKSKEQYPSVLETM